MNPLWVSWPEEGTVVSPGGPGPSILVAEVPALVLEAEVVAMVQAVARSPRGLTLTAESAFPRKVHYLRLCAQAVAAGVAVPPRRHLTAQGGQLHAVDD